MRLIDADALYGMLEWDNDIERYTLRGLEFGDEIPTIDPDSLRPKGRWVDHMVRDWRCSECSEKIHKVRNVDGYCYDDKPNYCPNCGADMRGESK